MFGLDRDSLYSRLSDVLLDLDTVAIAALAMTASALSCHQYLLALVGGLDKQLVPQIKGGCSHCKLAAKMGMIRFSSC